MPDRITLYREGGEHVMAHTWRWRKILGKRFGQRCRVICTGKLNSALVEFEDGWTVVTSRYAVRRAALANQRGET